MRSVLRFSKASPESAASSLAKRDGQDIPRSTSSVVMWCTRWFLILFLLPYPRASPFFLVLFLCSLVLHSRPCLYCIVLLTALFTSSCYWAPLALPMPSFLTTNDQTTVGRSADQRCWCDINDGHIFDPFAPIVTNGPRAGISSSRNDTLPMEPFSTSIAYNGSLPFWKTRALQPAHWWYSKWMSSSTVGPDSAQPLSPDTVPVGFTPVTWWPTLRQDENWFKKRYDLREYGLDLILDFGWGRGEGIPVGA
ncbi:hypothetical protein CALCODRAFT_494855, partial [Calocera cornea HHB12733]